MCAIIGALVWNATGQRTITQINNYLNSVFAHSIERGRDGRGWFVNVLDDWGVTHKSLTQIAKRNTEWGEQARFFTMPTDGGTLIANLRAEPTTEFVEQKSSYDQQPYKLGPWTIVHNGTIANDKELRTNKLPTGIDSAAIVELLAGDHMIERTSRDVADYFSAKMGLLKGSFAILATHDEHPGMVLAHCNYRPIWYVKKEHGFFFASARQYLGNENSPQMVPPYSTWAFFRNGFATQIHSRFHRSRRALVVCSGGLDSVVAACMTKASGVQIELVHFQYGSRAEGPEVRAVKDVAEYLGVPIRFFHLPIYKPEDSPLLQADSKIAGGEEGAEFAHEWVPARNLVMLSVATAMAEAGGFDTIVLGNNLEEAGAYPDNEPEFINRFNDILPFAVADGKQVKVIMPVGNLMKHEIVDMGLSLNAPLHLTWSCYRAGEKHCGTCGPCFMRRTAFKINEAEEVISYACQEV